MPGTSSIHEFGRGAGAAYPVVPHTPAYNAQEEAAVAHLPSRAWAKVVVCLVEGEPIQAVVPAPLAVNLDRLLELTGGSTIRLAVEDELRRLYPDREPGAIPPFGPICGQPVFVDVALAAEPEIVFNGGSHAEAIRIRWTDFATTVRPIVGRFAGPPLDKVGEFRLSYRE